MNRNVLITGGSAGLGKALINDFSSTHNITNLSRRSVANTDNINIDLNDLDSLFETLQSKTIKFDLCILNAGSLGQIKKAHDISYLDFQKSLNINIISNKIIIDWAIKNNCKNFLIMSSGAAIKNYDGWLDYCVSKAGLRSLILQYQKDLPKLFFRLISPGILKTQMNNDIKNSDIEIFPDMLKFHQTTASNPEKASGFIHDNYESYLSKDCMEIDLRNEVGW
jgi:benzil reductase ((S)-benzoin forming)